MFYFVGACRNAAATPKHPRKINSSYGLKMTFGEEEPTVHKVKSTIPREECWWGAQLPYLGLEPVGGGYTT